MWLDLDVWAAVWSGTWRNSSRVQPWQKVAAEVCCWWLQGGHGPWEGRVAPVAPLLWELQSKPGWCKPPSVFHPLLDCLQVVSTHFTKSIICSRAALTYAEAQSRIDDERLTDEVSVSEETPGHPAPTCTGRSCGLSSTRSLPAGHAPVSEGPSRGIPWADALRLPGQLPVGHPLVISHSCG